MWSNATCQQGCVLSFHVGDLRSIALLDTRVSEKDECMRTLYIHRVQRKEIGTFVHKCYLDYGICIQIASEDLLCFYSL